MASKQIDSFSTFLETVDEGVRSAKMAAKTNGSVPLGTLSAAAKAVLSRLLTEPGGRMPSEPLRRDLALGLLEFAGAVSELADRGLVAVVGNGASETLALTSDGR